MSGIVERDILAFVGGAALKRYQTLSRRTGRRGRRGEDTIETFARSGSIGSWVDYNGVIRKAAANVPRVNRWDTFAGAPADPPLLVIEGSRTNKALYNEDISTGWTNFQTTDSTNADTAPDGETTADRLIEDASASTEHYLAATSTITVTANETYAFSWPAKAGTRTWIALRISAAGGHYCQQYFDLSNGAVGTSSAAGTGAHTRSYIEPYGDDWYRCTLVGSIGSGITAVTPIVFLATGDGGITYSGDGSSYVLLWGTQFEDAAQFSSSYIGPTTSAPVTRNAESLSFPFYHHPQPMSIYAKFVEAGVVNQGGNPALFQIGASGGVDPRCSLYVNSTPGTFVFLHDTGAGVSAVTTGTPSVGSDVELLGELFSDGSVQVSQSINGATATVSSRSAALALASAWSATSIRVGNLASGYEFYNPLDALVVARGSHSLDEFRALLA